MDVTLFGMVTDVKLLQPEKAPPPMDVTLYVRGLIKTSRVNYNEPTKRPSHIVLV